MEDKEFWRNERVAFLALTTVKGIGFWSLHKIAQAKLGFKEVLRKPEGSGIEKQLGSYLSKDEAGYASLWSEGINLARSLTSSGVRLLFKDEPEFPKKLKNIHDAPEWIFIQGSPENLNMPAVSVVGTRKPSDDGLFLTKYTLSILSRLPCISVSGLALGIDQIAHTESLRYGLPTVAVLGTGILLDYPKGSEPLRAKIIASGGTVITEYLPKQSYSAETFVRRNRLQAALGDILIPTEWNIKSGTAHTVKFAAKYGKAIANIFLPYTLESRTEIPFSASEYGASWFEVPTKTDSFVDFLKQNLEINLHPVHPSAGSTRDESADTTNNDQDELPLEFGQIPLI